VKDVAAMLRACFTTARAPPAAGPAASRPAYPDPMVGRVYLERGEPVTVLIRWSGRGPRNVLIRRADGSEVVRPFRGLRRAVSLGPAAVPAGRWGRAGGGRAGRSRA
jgi:hypothetical protein